MTFARMFETDLAGLDIAILNAGIVKPDFEIVGAPSAGNPSDLAVCSVCFVSEVCAERDQLLLEGLLEIQLFC
jgi:hypothetical protein